MARGDPGEQFPMALQQSPALLNSFLGRNPIKIGPEIRCFIRELLLIFSLSSTTCNSAWVSRGFSVIKHV